MRKILFSTGLRENISTGNVCLVCVFMIVLLTVACACDYKKRKSAFSNETAQALVKSDSENSKVDDGQKMVCRTKVVTGSRFKKKICKSKAEWAALAKKNESDMDDYDRETIQRSGVYIPDATDAMGGQSIGPAH